MHNTHLQLNVSYNVIPFDSGYRFVEDAKTTNPLIPDEVIIRCFELRNMADTRFDEFDELFLSYRKCEGCYLGIPCPDIEGYSFNYLLKEGRVVSWKVSDNQYFFPTTRVKIGSKR